MILPCVIDSAFPGGRYGGWVKRESVGRKKPFHVEKVDDRNASVQKQGNQAVSLHRGFARQDDSVCGGYHLSSSSKAHEISAGVDETSRFGSGFVDRLSYGYIFIQILVVQKFISEAGKSGYDCFFCFLRHFPSDIILAPQRKKGAVV